MLQPNGAHDRCQYFLQLSCFMEPSTTNSVTKNFQLHSTTSKKFDERITEVEMAFPLLCNKSNTLTFTHKGRHDNGEPT